MHDFSDVVPTEDLLDEGGLLSEVGKVLSISVGRESLAVHFTSVVRPELGLDLYCRCLLPQKLLTFNVHLEL